MSIHSLGTYKHGFLSLRPCTLILQGREAITAGAEVADDRSLELCGLDLPSAPWKRGAGRRGWGMGLKEIPGQSIYFKWLHIFQLLGV